MSRRPFFCFLRLIDKFTGFLVFWIPDFPDVALMAWERKLSRAASVMELMLQRKHW